MVKNLLVILVLSANVIIALEPRAPALLCADQSDNRVKIIDPLAKTEIKPTLWSYPKISEEALKYMPTDAKRVEIDGIVHILASYHGRVRLVRFSDRKLIKDYSSYSSCHSAELLPDGNIVSANSNHGKLRIHRSEEDFTDLDIPYAHGVFWDKKAEQLWVLGDMLYRFGYRKGKLTQVKTYKLPLSPTGHDLFPSLDGGKLYVSNNDALFSFDLKDEFFTKVSEFKEIKSVSQHSDGSLWVTDPINLEGLASWQSNAVIRIDELSSKKAIRYAHKGAKFYKARWW